MRIHAHTLCTLVACGLVVLSLIASAGVASGEAGKPSTPPATTLRPAAYVLERGTPGDYLSKLPWDVGITISKMPVAEALKQLSQVRASSLHINGDHWPDDDLKALLELWRQRRKASEFGGSLRISFSGDARVERELASLLRDGLLTSFSFSAKELDVNSPVLVAIGASRSLTELSFGTEKLLEAHAKHLSAGSLARVTLGVNGAEPEAIAQFLASAREEAFLCHANSSPALLDRPLLPSDHSVRAKILRLWVSDLGRSCRWGEFVSRCVNTRSLQLSNMSGMELPAGLDWTCARLPQIQELTLMSPITPSPEPVSIEDALQIAKTSQITHLDLSCGVAFSAGRDPFTFFAALRGLTELRLFESSLLDERLLKLTSLRRLVAWPRESQAALTALQEVLPKLKLRRLRLVGNLPLSLVRTCLVLPGLESLELDLSYDATLDLTGTDLSSSSVTSLWVDGGTLGAGSIAALRGIPGLRRLVLSHADLAVPLDGFPKLEECFLLSLPKSSRALEVGQSTLRALVLCGPGCDNVLARLKLGKDSRPTVFVQPESTLSDAELKRLWEMSGPVFLVEEIRNAVYED